MHLVTRAEKTTYPWMTHSALATKIDRYTKESHVATVATSINPGFGMGLAPLVLFAALDYVGKVAVKRDVDFAGYPLPWPLHELRDESEGLQG